MKKLIGFIVLLLCHLLTYAQDTLTAEDLKPYAYTFRLANGKITGEGAGVWKKIIRQNHFLLPELADADFNYFALEVGPNAADKLEQLSTPPQNTLNQIRNFTRKYANKTFFKLPINFFYGYEDAAFLQKASEEDFDLWGLDQELYNSVEFLLDELLTLAEGSDDYRRIKKLHRRAVNRYKWLNLKDDLKKRFRRNCEMLKDEKINAFLDVFPKDHADAQKIIRAFRVSWQVYCDNEQRNYKKANQSRADYMKENFQKGFNRAFTEEAQPRVFAKMGDLHLSSGITQLGVDDIGKYMFELAEKKGLKATNIRHIRRYYQSKNKMTDYLDGSVDWIHFWRPYVELGKKDEWVIIDLRPFRKPLAKGQLKMKEWNAYDIQHYDFMLISPEDRRVRPLWKRAP